MKGSYVCPQKHPGPQAERGFDIRVSKCNVELNWGIMGREFVKSGIAMVTGGIQIENEMGCHPFYWGFQHAWYLQLVFVPNIEMLRNIGISEGQRQAIYADPNFNNGDWAVHPDRGLAVARQTAMITYRTHNVTPSFNGVIKVMFVRPTQQSLVESEGMATLKLKTICMRRERKSKSVDSTLVLI